MNTSTFQTASAGTPPPDPAKHVKYTQGMVLGVDDFTQEFAYLSNRDQWLAREAIGYGTVSGLHVELAPKDGDTEVSVSPGVAINPRGQLIRVTPRQCAKIGAWLALESTRRQLTDLGLSASSSLTAYVVLCYRDCPTDEMPVPGEPCRCDSGTMAASRVMDDFRLELSLTPPPQLEENAVRDFALWLRAIEVADFTPLAGDLEAFLGDIRAAIDPGSPPQSPPGFFYGSPPAGLQVPRADFCEWMRAALRLWVTELRPLWQAQCAPRSVCGCVGPCGCHGTGGALPDLACECLLLAEIAITRTGSAVTSATLDERQRPVLGHLRLLQELLLCGPCSCGENLSSPLAGGAELDDAALVAEDDFSGAHPASPGVSPAFARADHTHGLPPDPIPPHLARPGDHLNHNIAGDVSGTLGATVVGALQSIPVANTAPNAGDILQFDGATSRWIPAPAPNVGTGNFVERAAEGPYFIVAAGILSRDGTQVTPSYNRLRVTIPPTATNPTVTLGFPGYRRDLALIIKGTSLRGRPADFHVIDLTDRGFVIQFPGTETGFMIEVSRFNP